MAHKIEIDKIVATSIGLLEANSVLGNKVFRDAETSFNGGVGDEVTVTLPQVIDAKVLDDEGTKYSDINELDFKVKLTDEAYNAVKLNDRQLNFGIRDFGRQVLQPQASGVAKHCEKAVAGVLNEAIASDGSKSKFPKAEAISKAKPLAALAKASAEMTKREIPEEGRILAIGPELKEAFLGLESLQNASFAGDAQVITNGTLGRVLGFEVVVSPFITGGAVAFTEEAVALAVRAPGAPAGTDAAAMTHNGFALMAARQFVMDQQKTVSLMKTFVGATPLDTNRMVALKAAA
ncbi:P22 phage major capsid protein family protein [Streptomyces sp. x-19]|uniref:P22 phage major capsid protein family protein n=1 Tax=Streptomyces sp. x-19 TaxID=2789280 RepID=UPI0039817D3B